MCTGHIEWERENRENKDYMYVYINVLRYLAILFFM